MNYTDKVKVLLDAVFKENKHVLVYRKNGKTCLEVEYATGLEGWTTTVIEDELATLILTVEENSPNHFFMWGDVEPVIFTIIKDYGLIIDYTYLEHYEVFGDKKLHFEKVYGGVEGDPDRDYRLFKSISRWLKDRKDSIEIAQINTYGADSSGYHCFAEIFYYDLQEGE